jgi:hypothetical protein
MSYGLVHNENVCNSVTGWAAVKEVSMLAMAGSMARAEKIHRVAKEGQGRG